MADVADQMDLPWTLFYQLAQHSVTVGVEPRRHYGLELARFYRLKAEIAALPPGDGGLRHAKQFSGMCLLYTVQRPPAPQRVAKRTRTKRAFLHERGRRHGRHELA